MSERVTDVDSQLIDRVMDAITGQVNFDIRYVTEVERNVVATVAAIGVIDNGGLRYFFESDWPGNPDYSLFVRAFEAVGARDAAQALEDALALFPGGVPHEDLEARNAFLARHFTLTYEAPGSPNAKPIDAIEARMPSGLAVYPLIARYIHLHPELPGV